MTIPVIWGLVRNGEGYVLTQTPIVKDSDAFEKDNLITETDKALGAESENLLAGINTQIFEMLLTLDNPNGAPISIKIKVGDGEYTEIGWNETEGYFVDRRYTSSAGLVIFDYHFRYTSGPCDPTSQNFYILSDNGGVEVFCSDFKVPFYVLTLASPYSCRAELSVGGDVTVESLVVNEIASVWREFEPVEGETVLYVSQEALELDTSITTEGQVTAYSTSGEEITWTVVEGSSIVTLEEVTGGVLVKALGSGKATLAVVCGNERREIPITVYSGTPETDMSFDADGIVSGSWIAKGNEIIATCLAGDGYILSDLAASDFDCSVTFSLEAVAGAFIFRASEDMSDYIIFNYDNNEKIVKMWSPRGEIGRASAHDVNPAGVVLRVKATGTSVKAYINGRLAIDATLGEEEPTEGLLGLNVYSGTATFKSVVYFENQYTYGGTGSLAVEGDTKQTVLSLYNVTLKNTLVDGAFYTSSGRTLVINAEYFELLPVGSYTFRAVGDVSAYEFTVDVTAVTETTLKDLTLEKGCNAVIYLGNVQVESVTVNGKAITAEDYTVENYTLTIAAELLTRASNEIVINGNKTVTVTVI